VQVDKQMAAPAVIENAQLAPSETESLIKECGWKDGDSGDSAEEKSLTNEQQRQIT
jgi:hypothetical protein